MGKRPIDHTRPSDSKASKEYARVEREQADPMTDPKVKAMTKASESEGDDSAKRARQYARVEREQADPVTDPKVKAMTRSTRKDEDNARPSRLRKFLNFLRQRSES